MNRNPAYDGQDGIFADYQGTHSMPTPTEQEHTPGPFERGEHAQWVNDAMHGVPTDPQHGEKPNMPTHRQYYKKPSTGYQNADGYRIGHKTEIGFTNPTGRAPAVSLLVTSEETAKEHSERVHKIINALNAMEWGVK